MRISFICLAIATLISAPLAAQTERDTTALPASPRRAADPSPPGPPELSAAADHIAVLTLEQRTGAGRRTVSRTANRIHVALDDGREWLFVRNPVDGRRAMGYLVEHSEKRISTYAESDLRNAAGIRGWTDVLSLGFDPGALAELEPANEERTLGGIRFVRYAGEAGEVWWNAEQSLAAQVDLRGARLIVDSIRAGVDESLLQLPMTRFSDYGEASYADWLEDR